MPHASAIQDPSRSHAAAPYEQQNMPQAAQHNIANGQGSAERPNECGGSGEA